MVFAVYGVQLRAAETPENTFDSDYYRRRIAGIKEGFSEFKKALKTKNYVMKED